ncbi:MAG: response regulator [Burkholderiales bacterium]|nr:response regulator [Burkholderiales bacterium]
MKPLGNAARNAAAQQRAILRRMAERQAGEPPEEASADHPAGGLQAPGSDETLRLIHDLQVHQIELELQNEELRRVQDALEESRARYFALYDLAPFGYLTLDEQGVVLEANLTGANLLGVSRSALVRQHLSRYVVAEDADQYYLRCKALFKTGAPQSFELRLSRRGGGSFVASMEITTAPDEDGRAACGVVVSDITERKAVQETLRQSQALLQTAGQVAHVGGWGVRVPGNALVWSDEVSRMLEFPVGTVPTLAKVLLMYLPTSRRIITTALDACERDGTPFDCELKILTTTGRPIDIRVIGAPVRNAAGHIVGIEGACQDITEARQTEHARASLEAQLRESQKMEAIGTLAGGIAHDFNNILGTILGNAELARQDAGANWQALVSLTEIQKAAARAKDLVQQILSFSQRQPTSRRAMLLPPVVEESARLLRAVLTGGVKLVCTCAEGIPAVEANPTQVKQVLLNLGTNAAQAMRGRPGTIRLSVEAVVVDAAMAQQSTNLRPGRYVRIMFCDTGDGMDAATQRRIFEPFFTTKPGGEGTGLGLAVVHGIMQTHDGAIAVHSAPGKGSCFELYFPQASALAPSPGTTETAGPASEGRGQRILYIDDDEAQLFMVKRMMERWGYRVSAYREQREALDAVRAGEVKFDLVVTDFSMPGLSGIDVARGIRAAQPDLPVILVSGYVTESLRAQAADAGVREVLTKPHEIEELRDAVQRLVSPPSKDRKPA